MWRYIHGIKVSGVPLSSEEMADLPYIKKPAEDGDKNWHPRILKH